MIFTYREVRDQQRGMQNKSHRVVEDLGRRESHVTTFMCEDPDSCHIEALKNSVE